MHIRSVVISTAMGILVIGAGCSSGGTDSKRMAITMENNPTTNAGRGSPTLGDRTRPAAWIYVDGKAGAFKEQDDHQLLQWIIDQPVSNTPTFRVEALTGPDLVQPPVQFKCVLQTRESESGPRISYGIAADDDTFELGRDYSLLNPGEGFSIRNPETGELVPEIDPLAPGKYMLAGSIEGEGADGPWATVAVTYFEVGE